ncbi:MAG: hypothetical protein F6K35_41215 [Okeania sp. SIO2H7]|nr:hypothetical protein [Okeania sp. SIO2H7]
MTVLVIATVSGFSTWSIHREKQRFQQGLELQAATILNTMVAASKDAFYTKDFDGIELLLENLTKELESDKILTSGLAYQAQGRLISDAFAHDVSVYSGQPDPFGQYLVQNPDVITFREGVDLIAGRPVTLAGQTLGCFEAKKTLAFSTTATYRNKSESRYGTIHYYFLQHRSRIFQRIPKHQLALS